MSILVDTNLLVYATVASTQHEAARVWLTERFADRESFVGLSWASLYALVRLVSNRRIVGDEAVSLDRAWQAAEAYRFQPTARLLEPGLNHARIAGKLFATSGLTSNDVPDVYLAALAIEHGVDFATHDRGFARFPGLRWFDPLAV